MVTRVNPYVKAQMSYSLFKYYIMIQQKSNFPKEYKPYSRSGVENFFLKKPESKKIWQGS